MLFTRSDVRYATYDVKHNSHISKNLDWTVECELAYYTYGPDNYLVDAANMGYQGAIFWVDEYDYRRLFSKMGDRPGVAELWLLKRQPLLLKNGNEIKVGPGLSIIKDQPLPLIRIATNFRLNKSPILTTPIMGRIIGEINSCQLTDLHAGHIAEFPTCEQPFRLFADALILIKAKCLSQGLDYLHYGKPVHTRLGKRWVDSVEIILPEEKKIRNQGLCYPGAIWRPREDVEGLRSRLNVQTTQGLSPELFHLVANYDKPPEPDIFSVYESVRCEVAHAVDETPKNSKICVASCFSTEMMDDFISSRSYLADHWIILSEIELEKRTNVSNIIMPILYGQGVVFQLARLFVLTGTPDRSKIITCLNDLQTDWIPREERYQAGVAALEAADLVFPAMSLNMPCPFQDFVGFSGCLQESSYDLVRTVSTFGWIYGIDEIWCIVQGFPTTPVREVLGAAGHPQVNNPLDSVLIRQRNGMFYQEVASKGNFNSIINSLGLLITPKTNHIIPIESVPITLKVGFWEKVWVARLTKYFDLKVRVIAFIIWGTRGDRVPIEAAIRDLRNKGYYALGLEAMDVKAGLEGLYHCETKMGHRLIKPLLMMRAIISGLRFPIVHPSYFGNLKGHLNYSLAPTEFEAGRPRGGLMMPFDIIVPFIKYYQEHIWVAARSQGLYFPRSHNGKDFITPTPNIGTYEKGVVLGSSAIPIPAEFRRWPVVPSGDHMSILPRYKTIACAGGAGVVQTAKACGCSVITWDDSIDRQWFNPNDAGDEVLVGQKLNRWILVGWYFYPKDILFQAMRYPNLLYDYIKFVIRVTELHKRIWAVIFTTYCVYKSFTPMPTLEGSIVRMIVRAFGFYVAPGTVLVITWALRAYIKLEGISQLQVLVRLARTTAQTAIDPLYTTLTILGLNWMVALSVVFVWSKLPEPGVIIPNIKSGIIDPTENSGVWVVFSPIKFYGIPYASHVSLYDIDEGFIYEGVHENGATIGVGETFKFVGRPAYGVRTVLAIKTSIPSFSLSSVQLKSKPYSHVWNCQTIVLQVCLKYSAVMTPIAFIFVGLGVLNASLLLFLAMILIFFVTSSSWLVLSLYYVMNWDPSYIEKELISLNSAIRSATMVGASNEATELDNLRQLSADLCHSAILDGVEPDVAFEAIRNSIALESGSIELINYLRERPEGFTEIADTPNVFTKTILAFIARLKTLGVSHSALEGVYFSVDRVIKLMSITSSLSIYLVGRIVNILPLYVVNHHFSEIRAFVDDICDIIDTERTRKKNAWVPLPIRTPQKLNFAAWVAVTMAREFYIDGGDPFKSVVDALNKHVPGGEDLLNDEFAYVRPTFRPRRPRVTNYELKYDSLLHEVAYRIDPVLQKRVELYESMGATPGIDGVWLATPEWQDANIKSRYMAVGRPYSAYEYDLMLEASDMLYQTHPEAFDSPKIVTPSVVARQLITKYSSGLPFIQRYAKRQQLWESGWMNSIIQSTYERLKEGSYPQQLYHNFPKMQIVTKPRMVTAEGLASTFVSQVTQLEPDKRPVWDDVGFGMGATINSKYLGNIFDKISDRKIAFTADVTDLDSNIPPIIFEGLIKMKEKGLQKGGIPPAVAIQRAKYYAMQNATMVNLETGTILPKNRGGATGQSATSFDNHWGFRLSMVMMWSHATGMPPKDFYKYNTVHNTGDDNVWGTDSEITPEQLSDAARDLLGYDLRIETSGSMEELSYLSRLCIPTASVSEDAAVAGITSKYVAVFDRKRTMLRRSAVNSRFSGRPLLEYTKHLIERSIGHLQNCAFDRLMYSIIIKEYMEDCETFVGSPGSLGWNIETDEEGHVLSAQPFLIQNVPISTAAMARFKRLKSALKAPTYHRILKLSGEEKEIPPPISKYRASRLDTSILDLINIYTAEIRANLNYYLPEYLAKFRTNIDSLPPGASVHIGGYPIESYLWRVWQQEGIILTQSEIAIRCRESPFAPATDPNGFFWYTQIPGVQEKLSACPLYLLRGRAIVSLFWYMIIGNRLERLTSIPGLGWIIHTFMIFSRDLPRWYSLLSSLFWVSTGKVSHELAGLMPRDPYANIKVLSVWLSSYTPDFLCMFIGSLVIPEGIIVSNNLLAAILSFRPFRDSEMNNGIRSNPWLELSHQILSNLNSHRHLILSSPTATGKSTMLIAALAKGVAGRIWLIVPRILLRENYSNPFTASAEVKKLMKGASDEGQKILVLTYGHFITRVRANKGPRINDIVVMDEFHENSPEQGISVFLAQQFRILALSATPDLLYAKDWFHMEPSISRPFGKVETFQYDLNIEALHTEAEKKFPEITKTRVLYIIPTINEASRFQFALEHEGIPARLVTRNDRSIPESGSIVATQVVDSGIDINPGVDLVVDSGLMLRQHKGRLVTTATDPATMEQRKGRTGRRRIGYYITTTSAGTGPVAIPYPTWSYVMADDTIREHLFEVLEIKLNFQKMGEGSSPIDPFMKFTNDFSIELSYSLSLYWLLMNSCHDSVEARRQYIIINQRGFSESHEYFEGLLTSAYGSQKVIPLEYLSDSLKSSPFMVSFQGLQMRCRGINIVDNETLPIIG